MKRFGIVVLSAVLVIALAGSAFAANSLQQGKFGISVGMGDSVFSHKAEPLDDVKFNDIVDISARYLVSKDLAVYGGFGLQIDSGDADGTYLSLTAGVRKYLRVDDFAPFVAGQFSFISVDRDEPLPAADLDVIDFAALFGAEYFVGKQFSLEGAIGFGFGQASSGNVDDTYFGTRTVGVHANFYF